MDDPSEEFEPLFDYSRVQPNDIVNLDDDSFDESPVFLNKRRKFSASNAEKKVEDKKVTEEIDLDDKDEEDWLPPPPKITHDTSKLDENSTLKELRLKRQELASYAKSAQDVLREVEETVQRDFNASLKSSAESSVEQSSKPSSERPKLVITIQDKNGQKQFRIFKDEKFERVFKMYADKIKVDKEKLVFTFDGDKIIPNQTPDTLGMEDDDMIEVRVK